MAPDTVRLWLGTSPEATHADGAGTDAAPAGIWSVDLDTATGRLADPVLRARTPAPSFLALSADGRSLFAAGETSPGAVTRFVVGPGGELAQAERVSSGGSGPCHLLLHPDGRALYVANYASGSVGVVPLRRGADGSPELVGGVAQVFEHSGRGPVADRQEGPHVHSTLLAPDGAVLLAFDLGTDEVRRYRVRADGLLDAEGVALLLPPGTGPRHAAWGPGGHLYVTGELDARVRVLAWDGEELRPVAVVPVAEPAGSPGSDGVLTAHVVVHGDTVLASVRGPDVVVAWRAADGGARLEPVGAVATGRAVWPRHFTVIGGGDARGGGGGTGAWLVVAGQRSDLVVVLPTAAEATGRAGEPAATAAVPAPTCVVAGRGSLPDAG